MSGRTVCLNFSIWRYRPQSTQRVAIADFWRTSHHDGEISSCWWGWGGGGARPSPSAYFNHVRSCSVRSPAEMAGADTLPLFHLYPYMQSCGSAFISSGSGSSILGWIPIRIRIQSGSRALMTKNWKKITAENFLFWIKNYNLPIPRPPRRRSLQLSKEAIQHFKTWTFKKNSYFCG